MSQHTKTLAENNQQLLSELLAVLERISDDQFQLAANACSNGIGPHVRHVLDHYDAFNNGRKSGLIDYDMRARDVATQTRLAVSKQRLTQTIEQLGTLTGADPDELLTVQMDCDADQSLGEPVRSTLARELQFLVSHTVHHAAIIRAWAIEHAIEIERGFGKAASTVRHENSNATHAKAANTH